MVLISTDLGYITRLHQIDSGQSWESLSGFKEERLTENDLSLATLKHRKNGKCTYNLSRYLQRLINPSFFDHLKIRSDGI